MIGYGKTDKGLQRANNEDSIFVENNAVGGLPNLYVVADGMGGYRGGEVASSNAIIAIHEYVLGSPASFDILDILVSAVNYANKRVYELSQRFDEYSEMGTTIVASSISDNKLYAAHVGDSRLYVINDSGINQLTTDHSYVMEMIKAGKLSYEEARTSPDRNIITRAVGIDEKINIDGIVAKLKPDDVVLMCTDGLNGMLEDEYIYTIAKDKSKTIEQRTDELICRANQNGGKDNISVILFENGS